VETNRIFLQDGSGVVKIRSAGLGPAVVSARTPGWPPAQATIAYRWPIVFLTAALLGGVLGALGAYVNAKRRVRSMLMRYLTRGVVVGLVVCVVYFGIGINLLQFKIDVRFFNEIAVFALAALSAMFGIPALAGAARSGGGGS
jgi:hypothetical protein